MKRKKKSRKSDARSPSQLTEKLKKIVVTREVYARSEHSSETPTPNFLCGVRLSRSATRRRASAINNPPPPPASSRASIVPQSPATTAMDGVHFREDPCFRTWHRSLLRGVGPENASIGAFENDIGIQDRVPPYEAGSRELETSRDDSESRGERCSPAPVETPRCSADSDSDDYRSLSCAPLQLQSVGIGRSASLLKARIAKQVWIGKSLKARLRSSRPEELARIQHPGGVAIPRQVTSGRRLRSQKKSENLRVGSGMMEEAIQSNTTLRLVNADVEEPQTHGPARDPELTAMLHDPNQNRFSDSWEKFYEEQTQGDMKEDSRLPTNTVFPSDEALASRAMSSPSAMSKPLANGATCVARDGDRSYPPIISQKPTTDITDARMKADPPIIKVTESRDEAPKLVSPSPGPRTSSKGGIFAKFMGPGKIPPSVTPLLNRARPLNISKSRKVSESSVIADYDDGMNPAHSTDTLAKIEVELQGSPTGLSLVDIGNVPTRFTRNLSIDSGPSGSAPDRELPELPEDGASENSRSRGSSRNRQARKQSITALGHTRNKPSASSLSTVRGISPSRIEPAGSHTHDHARRIDPDAPQRVAYGQCFDTVPFDPLAIRTSKVFRSTTSMYGSDYSFPASTEAFLRKQAQKAARAESRRLIKQRDMASHGSIKEENESDMVPALTDVTDPVDQFPELPCPPSASRASSRRARSTQRCRSLARRVPARGIASQLLSASRIMTIEDAGPATPNLSNAPRSQSTKSRPPDSPLREESGSPFRQKAKISLPKKSSHRSIRSPTSTSALTLNGAHTPPSSDSCASDDEQALSGMHRLDLRREILEIRALVIMQGRTIDKLQNAVKLYMPNRRSRSRDISQDRRLQLTPLSSRYPGTGIDSLSSNIAADGTEPGLVMTGDMIIGSADEALRYDVGGTLPEYRRLSGAPLTAKMDSMVAQAFRRLG